MKRTVMALTLLAGALTQAPVWAARDDVADAAREEDEAIDRAVAEAERDALAPPAPLALRSDKPLVTAPAPEGLGIGTKLALCALVGGAAFWVVRSKLQRRNADGSPAKGAERPRVVSRTAIGLRHEVVVVEIEGQRFVLGVAPGSVASLGVLPDAPVLAAETPELDMDRARVLVEEGEPPIVEGLSRILAAGRAAQVAAERRTPLVPASEIRERLRAAPQMAAVEDDATRPRAAVRRRATRPAASPSDTLREGQVRGLPRRATP